MLLPALAKAKERARLIQCVNNQKQIELCFAMYAEDNNATYPLTHGWNGQGGSNGVVDDNHGGGAIPEQRPPNAYAADLQRSGIAFEGSRTVARLDGAAVCAPAQVRGQQQPVSRAARAGLLSQSDSAFQRVLQRRGARSRRSSAAGRWSPASTIRRT